MNTFIQISGHPGCFKEGTKPDTILKLSTSNEEECLRRLAEDPRLNPFVPRIVGAHKEGDSHYLEMQNLLANFKEPAVMDIKMGCRTYCEKELLATPKKSLASPGPKLTSGSGDSQQQLPTSAGDSSFELRADMYEKMVKIDSTEPSKEENKLKAITKPRYMIWRETISSTASLGFRIEGMRLRDGTIHTNFKLMKHERDIWQTLSRFFSDNKSIASKYLKRLKDLRKALTESKLFFRHEIIGSSLLFVHDDSQASLWMIDFAKTYQLADKFTITHQNDWQLGNHEDGYLTGLNNLIRIIADFCTHIPPSCPDRTPNNDGAAGNDYDRPA